ncbi:hypothetical protein JW859_09695 [bacterium]|nr:hypothetical protein [bacterium]
MAQKQEENFLSVPACPFRRVSFGTAHCTISTDSHVSEVDPLTCLNCEVPRLIDVPRCRYLSLGTELKPYRGEGKLVTALACRALNIKLYHLKTCEECPLYSEVPSLADQIKQSADIAQIQVPLREELVEQIARDVKLDYGVRDEETPPLLPIRCWRFPEGHCRKMPVYTRHKASVILKYNDRNNELYKSAIKPALVELNLQPYRIDEEIASDEEMCRVCENVQESDYAIYSLDDWSSHSLFLIGIMYGIGRKTALIKNDSAQPVPLTDYVAHDIIHYSQVGELKEKVSNFFSAFLKPGNPET